jgi:hypothetical protein
MASSEGAAGAGTTTRTAAGAQREPHAAPDERFPDPLEGSGEDKRGKGATAGDTRSLARRTTQALSVSCLANAHYHAGREAFLDTVHRWFMFGVVACGAAALADLVHNGLVWLKASFAAMAALLGALDLTFDLSNRARMHAIMKRRYFELWADLRNGRKHSEEVPDCLDRFSADEEPPYRALYIGCWNRAQKEVCGPAARHFDIWVSHRWIKNIVRLPTVDFGEPYPIKEAPTGTRFWDYVKKWWRGSAVRSESVAVETGS